MGRFPVDAPKALRSLGFEAAREAEHIAMVRTNADGSRTPLTIPNHTKIKGSTLRTICSHAGIPRDEFLTNYQNT